MYRVWRDESGNFFARLAATESDDKAVYFSAANWLTFQSELQYRLNADYESEAEQAKKLRKALTGPRTSSGALGILFDDRRGKK